MEFFSKDKLHNYSKNDAVPLLKASFMTFMSSGENHRKICLNFYLIKIFVIISRTKFCFFEESIKIPQVIHGNILFYLDIQYHQSQRRGIDSQIIQEH